MACNAPQPFSANYLGNSNYAMQTKERSGYSGLYGTHPNATTYTYDSSFRTRCNAWAEDLRITANAYGFYGYVDWIGSIGVCVEKPGPHNTGHAFDCTAVCYTDTTDDPDTTFTVDCNVHWRESEPLASRRKYLAVAASTRQHFGTVLTAWFNGPHENHIHFDDAVGGGVVIRESATADAQLVRAAARYLNGSSVAISQGAGWTSATETAYVGLLSAFNMKCYDPKTYASHAQLFATMIERHAHHNTTAGYYQLSC